MKKLDTAKMSTPTITYKMPTMEEVLELQKGIR